MIHFVSSSPPPFGAGRCCIWPAVPYGPRSSSSSDTALSLKRSGNISSPSSVRGSARSGLPMSLSGSNVMAGSKCIGMTRCIQSCSSLPRRWAVMSLACSRCMMMMTGEVFRSLSRDDHALSHASRISWRWTSDSVPFASCGSSQISMSPRLPVILAVTPWDSR